MRLLVVVFALLSPALGSTPESIRRGLGAESRGARETAEREARALARTDPGALSALWDDLDAAGRRVLVRALASAGTRHAALVAHKLVAGDKSPEIFRALLKGLTAGGKAALFAEPESPLAQSRRRAIDRLQLRWKIEEELVRLKAPAGSTGNFTGQFVRFKPLGAGVVSVFLDIVVDRAAPLAGEASEGPYKAIHPEMVRYEHYELRNMAAHGFGEVARKDDRATIERLEVLFDRYWDMHEDEPERDLAPSLAYSLFDLGHNRAVDVYINDLRDRESGRGYDAMLARWSLGYAYIRTGKHEAGEAMYMEILRTPNSAVSRDVAAYNLACNFASRARKEPQRRQLFKRLALDYLETAILRLKWWDWSWMEADGDLAFIRDEPRYKRLLAHLKKKWPDRRKGKHSKDPKDFLGK